MILTLVMTVGCAHRGTTDGSADGARVSGAPGSEESEVPVVQIQDVESFRVNDPEPPQVIAEELEAIPTEVNEKVEQWLKYFQGSRGRPHMERYLSRMTRYSTLMKRILKRNGLPEDLIYIALIESGFSSKATSHAAAVGYWQFIRGTGKRYGLEINTLVDERRDPVLSTQAAAEYYRSLYGEFNSWYLSMAAYNVGENRVRREINRNFTKDFWTLVKKRRLPKETMNYVPKYIAARMIGKNPEQYGFANIEYEQPLEFELIRFDKPISLKVMAEKMNMEYEELRILNPKFRGDIAPTKENGVLELKIPLTMSQVALKAAAESVVDKVEYIADTGETETYRIRSGDSLYSIARKHRTTIGWLKDVNDLKPGRKLRIGQRMIVPVPGSSGKALAQSKRKKPPEPAQAETKQAAENVAVANPEIVKGNNVFYVVQAGDTLSEIAEEYDSTVRELRKMNRLSKRMVLRPGMRLRVPKDEGLPEDPNEPNKVRADSKVDAEPDIEKADQKDEQEVTPEDKKSSRAQARRPAQKAMVQSKAVRKNVKVAAKKVVIAQKKRPLSFIHTVKRGESLTQIAEKYGVALSELVEKNAKFRNRPLYVGSKVLVPNRSTR